MEEDILKYSETVVFRGTLCIWPMQGRFEGKQNKKCLPQNISIQKCILKVTNEICEMCYCQKCTKELITNRFATKEWYKTVDILFVCIKDGICVYCFDFSKSFHFLFFIY